MINGKCYGISKYLINLLAIVVTLQTTAYCRSGNPTASGAKMVGEQEVRSVEK